MTYAWIQDVPINLATYEQIKAKIGDQPPQGLILHLVAQTERGLRYLDVRESTVACDRFFAERVHPALGRVFARVGFQPRPGSRRARSSTCGRSGSRKRPAERRACAPPSAGAQLPSSRRQL